MGRQPEPRARTFEALWGSSFHQLGLWGEVEFRRSFTHRPKGHEYGEVGYERGIQVPLDDLVDERDQPQNRQRTEPARVVTEEGEIESDLFSEVVLHIQEKQIREERPIARASTKQLETTRPAVWKARRESSIPSREHH